MKKNDMSKSCFHYGIRRVLVQVGLFEYIEKVVTYMEIIHVLLRPLDQDSCYARIKKGLHKQCYVRE